MSDFREINGTKNKSHLLILSTVTLIKVEFFKIIHYQFQKMRWSIYFWKFLKNYYYKRIYLNSAPCPTSIFSLLFKSMAHKLVYFEFFVFKKETLVSIQPFCFFLLLYFTTHLSSVSFFCIDWTFSLAFNISKDYSEKNALCVRYPETSLNDNNLSRWENLKAVIQIHQFPTVQWQFNLLPKINLIFL